MKAIYYTQNGGPEVMAYGDLPDPEVGPDSLLVRVEWISIEGGDLLNRLVTPPAHTPFVPGYQAAGTVVAVGERVTRFQPGDKVVGFNFHGSHAELFIIPEHYAFPIPQGMEVRLASLVPIAFATAHDALFEYGHVKAGEYVLIQGAAGGVGLAAVQLAVQAGAIVIGTAAGAQRLEKIRPYGLHHGIDHRTQDIAEACLALTNGQGVDLVLDMAGGAGKDQLLRAVRGHGRYAVIGASTGSLPSFAFFELVYKALNVIGISLARDMHTPRVHHLVGALLQQVHQGKLQMPIAAEFPLAQAQEAHRFVAEGHPFGRVLMHVGA